MIGTVCPPLPPGWLFVDGGDRLVFHARPSSQGRPTVEVALSPDGSLRVSATAAEQPSYERDAFDALRQQLVDRADLVSTYLRQREWLRARLLRGETPPPDPYEGLPETFGASEATRDLWVRAILRLALAPASDTSVSRLLRRAVELGSAQTRALAVTVAIVVGELESVIDVLRDMPPVEKDAPWLAAIIACWRGDFVTADGALRQWLDGTHPRRVPIAAQLYSEAACATAASAIARAALEVLPPTDATAAELLRFVDPSDPIAQLPERIAAATQSDPAQVTSLAQTLIRRGEFQLARDLYARGVDAWPRSAALLREFAELLLWAGAFDDAEPLIRRLASIDVPCAVLLEASRQLARGSLAAAEKALRSVPRSARADRRYVVLWDELLVRRGQHHRARRLLTEASGSHQVVAGRILGAMCAIRCGDTNRAVTGEEEEFGWIRTGELAALTPDEPAELPLDGDQLYARLQRALENLRGNRSETPTVAAAGGVLRHAVSPPDMRERSVDVIFHILHRDPERVLQDFGALIAEYPGSANPYCYRGELLLWLGRYDEAEIDFRRAHDISRLRRWAYVGLSAVSLLRGRPQDTLAIAKQCDAACGPNSAATLGVYVGEAHRSLGHRRRAIRALDAALAARPTRLGARINRALVETGRNAERLQADAWRHVCASAPGLAAAAHADVSSLPGRGDHAARLRACLTRMLGNRSSNILSYVDGDGQFRVRRIDPKAMIESTKEMHRECIIRFFNV
jgi:tetratricopeptide (TPR) repeat protein